MPTSAPPAWVFVRSGEDSGFCPHLDCVRDATRCGAWGFEAGDALALGADEGCGVVFHLFKAGALVGDLAAQVAAGEGGDEGEAHVGSWL